VEAITNFTASVNNYTPVEAMRKWIFNAKILRTTMWANVMVGLPNIGGALCSTPQSLADAHYQMPCSNDAKTRNQLKFVGVFQTPEPISAFSGARFTTL